MYICLCRRVTDSEIRHSHQELEEMGVGINCGRCLELAQQIRRERDARVPEGGDGQAHTR